MVSRGVLPLHVLIGLPALVLATSCVPQDASVVVQQIPEKPTPAALLRGLALDVPADIAAASVVQAVPPPLQTPAPAFVAAARSEADAARASDCLTAAIYYEARSQSRDGQRAVAQVVLNRVRDRAYPGSVCGVVYQGSERSTGCQFSFTCDGSMDRPRDPAAWARAAEVAAGALSGDVYAPVGAATSYHADSIVPWWASSLSRVAQVGEHIFYRWQGGLARALNYRQAYAGIEPARGGGGAAQVAIHYAGSPDAGVTIHRGGGDQLKVATQPHLAEGVRIHRNTEHPGGDASEDAVVSAETTAI